MTIGAQTRRAANYVANRRGSAMLVALAAVGALAAAVNPHLTLEVVNHSAQFVKDNAGWFTLGGFATAYAGAEAAVSYDSRGHQGKIAAGLGATVMVVGLIGMAARGDFNGLFL